MSPKPTKETVINLLREISGQLDNKKIPVSTLEQISGSLTIVQSFLETFDTAQPMTSDTGRKQRNETGRTQTTPTIFIWSDGACSGNPGPGGWGTIIQVDDVIREISGFNRRTTNNIMELTGALEGIKQTPPNSKIVLTSDSQYLVRGMTNWIHGWKRKGWRKADGMEVLNKEIWMELDRESQQRQITWEWVKGHANHPQNERCDELAREAITNKFGIEN